MKCQTTQCSARRRPRIPFHSLGHLSAVAAAATVICLYGLSVSAQKTNFRPYNPIQDIFDSIFRGPPGAAGLPPSPPGSSRVVLTSSPSSAPPLPIKPNKSSGTSLPRINFALTAPGNRPPPQGPKPKPQGPQGPPQGNNKPGGGPGSPPGTSSRRPKSRQPKLPPLLPPPPLRRPHQPLNGRAPPQSQRVILRPHGVNPNLKPPHPLHHSRQLQLQQQKLIQKLQHQHQEQVRLSSTQETPSSPSPSASLGESTTSAAAAAALQAALSSSSVSPPTHPTIIDELNLDVPTVATTSSHQHHHHRPPGGVYIRTVGQTGEPTRLPHHPPTPAEVISDNAFAAPQIDVNVANTLDETSSSEDAEVPAPSAGFRLQPRGHSRPVVINRFQPSFKASQEDGTPEALPTASPRVQKKPRFLNHDRDAGHHHSHHHHHHQVLDDLTVSENKISERIDEVRELVDCGGRDLGFCDMSSKYPGHMMGNLMSDCQELIYKGFVPVPEDLDELGDNDPVAKYSNSSRSSVRAQQGSWSWKPYRYKKKQICDSELRYIRPGYALDSTGKWQVIVQTEEMPQRVAIDLCRAPSQPCYLMSDCGRKSRCVQRYSFQHLLAIDPDNLHHDHHHCPTIRAFKFPSACVCHVELPDHGFAGF